MDADVQNLANWSQIIALVIAVIALVLQVIIWRYPSQASAQSVFRYVRWVLLLIFVASSFFLLGSRFTSSSSTQGERPEAIAVSSAPEQEMFQLSQFDSTPEKTPTPTGTPSPTKTPSPTPTNDPTLESYVARCKEVLESYPQTPEAIISYFRLPAASEVTVLRQGCGNIVTGFALNGTTEVELQLPEGTCATFDGKYYGSFNFDRGHIGFAPEPSGIRIQTIGGFQTPMPHKVMGGLVKISAANLTYRWTGCSE